MITKEHIVTNLQSIIKDCDSFIKHIEECSDETPWDINDWDNWDSIRLVCEDAINYINKENK